MHPFKAVPFNAGMRGFFPWKQEKHQAQKQVNKLADDGNSYPKTFVNRHSDGMHSSTNRIYCPLKLCTYEAKQMNEMRTHWNLQHRGMEFPELRDETSFAYGIDSGNQKNVIQFWIFIFTFQMLRFLSSHFQLIHFLVALSSGKGTNKFGSNKSNGFEWRMLFKTNGIKA